MPWRDTRSTCCGRSVTPIVVGAVLLLLGSWLAPSAQVQAEEGDATSAAPRPVGEGVLLQRIRRPDLPLPERLAAAEALLEREALTRPLDAWRRGSL